MDLSNLYKRVKNIYLNRLVITKVTLLLKAKKQFDKGHKIRGNILCKLALILRHFDGSSKTVKE